MRDVRSLSNMTTKLRKIKDLIFKQHIALGGIRFIVSGIQIFL